jgi:hypothetical protein
MIKETPFHKLPRQPRNIIVEAERQGFDDGYFGNERFYSGKVAAADVYHKAFDDGKLQRAVIEKTTHRKVKP